MQETNEQKKELLTALDSCDFVYFDNRRALGLWWNALAELLQERKIDAFFRESRDEQYGRLEIRKHREEEKTVLTISR